MAFQNDAFQDNATGFQVIDLAGAGVPVPHPHAVLTATPGKSDLDDRRGESVLAGASGQSTLEPGSYS